MPVDPTGAQVKALVTSDLTGPIQMLNLLRFKPEGGRESYDKYLAGTSEFLARVGGEVLYRGDARQVVIGDETEWDLVLVVRYPSKEAFLEMLRIPEYQEVTPFRTDALLDARLIACTATG